MTDVVVVILWSVVEMLMVGTGALVVRLVSRGRWRAEPTGCNEARTFGAAGALSFLREGQRVVTTNGLMFAGLMFYGVLMAMVVVLSNAAL